MHHNVSLFVSGGVARRCETSAIVLGLSEFIELQEVPGDGLQVFANLCGGSPKEFAAEVDLVDALVGETAMQFFLDTSGVSVIIHSMHVIFDRYRRVTQIANSIGRVD